MMSPLMRARFHRFRQNKLGVRCLILFLIIFILSLFAELIANDKPLLVRYQQSLYFPIFKDYPETTFGGVFETATDYQDPAVKQLIQNQGWMISPPVAFSYQSPNLSLTVPVPPNRVHKTGLERMIRDEMYLLVFSTVCVFLSYLALL
jgi:microcin C transport system permease protein